MDGQKKIVTARIPRLKKTTITSRSNWRLIWLALLFFIVLLAIIYFQSGLSRLSAVEVVNNELIDDEEILGQAQLELGMSYFDIRVPTVKENLEALPFIAEAEVSRKLPNRLTIKVEEHPIIALWREEGAVFPVLNNGYIAEEAKVQKKIERPILNSWPHRDGVEELSRELTLLSPAIYTEISEIVLNPTPADPYRLTLYMLDGFEVITSIRQFSEHMSWYPHIKEELISEGRHNSTIYLLEGKWAEDSENRLTEYEQEEEVDHVQDENQTD